MGGAAGAGNANGTAVFGFGMEDAGGAGSLLREDSVVLLRYQISAPPPMTETKVKKTSRMPRQDFMGVF